MKSYRKKILSLFEQHLTRRVAQELAAAETRPPRIKPLENLSETDSEEKAAEAARINLEVQTPPFEGPIFADALLWVRDAKNLKFNGHVQVGAVAYVDDGECFYLLIAPGDKNPLSCTELGEVGGIPARVVSDSCPLAQALLGAPVTDNWSREVVIEEGERVKRRSKFCFEGKVLAIS